MESFKRVLVLGFAIAAFSPLSYAAIDSDLPKKSSKPLKAVVATPANLQVAPSKTSPVAAKPKTSKLTRVKAEVKKFLEEFLTLVDETSAEVGKLAPEVQVGLNVAGAVTGNKKVQEAAVLVGDAGVVAGQLAVLSPNGVNPALVGVLAQDAQKIMADANVQNTTATQVLVGTQAVATALSAKPAVATTTISPK